MMMKKNVFIKTLLDKPKLCKIGSSATFNEINTKLNDPAFEITYKMQLSRAQISRDTLGRYIAAITNLIFEDNFKAEMSWGPCKNYISLKGTKLGAVNFNSCKEKFGSSDQHFEKLFSLKMSQNLRTHKYYYSKQSKARMKNKNLLRS